MFNFNSQPVYSAMKDFTKFDGLTKLIKINICFKGQGTYINLRFLFKHSNSYKTGISDNYHLKTMLKSDPLNS